MRPHSDREALARRAARSQSVWDHAGTERLLARAHAVNANSRWTKADALARCPSAGRAEVVYYGSALGPPAATGAARPRPYVLCVARLAEYKGLDLLLMAFSEIAARVPGVDLLLCGEDHSSGGLMRFARALNLGGRVRWAGRLGHDQTRALIRDCLFLVLPSRRESLGGALIEALQEGKAVAATRVGGIPEIVRHGREGLLVPPKSVPALARALARLAEDPALRRRLGKAGRRRARVFSWEKAVGRYEAAYRTHPRRSAGSGSSAFVVWDRSDDSTALVLARNAARVFAARGRRVVVVLRRSDAREPFRTAGAAGTVYRVGLPGEGVPERVDDLVTLGQLLVIASREGIGVWHFFLLRYRRLAALEGLDSLLNARPVVTLA